MVEFSRVVLRNVSVLSDELGFRMSLASSGPAFAAMVRRQSDLVCGYLFFKDERAGSGMLNSYFWLAPWDFPDDGFDNLGVGYRIGLASTVADELKFFESVVKRVRVLVQYLTELTHAVEAELGDPSCKTRRLLAYRRQLALFQFLKKHAEDYASLGLAQVLDSANLVVRGEKSLSSFERDCHGFAVTLIGAVGDLRYSDLSESGLLVGDAHSVALDISRQSYVDALVAGSV